MKTTPKLCISPSLEPQGVFIGTREEGARGQTLAQNAAAAAAVLPRKRGQTRVSAAIKWPRAAYCAVFSCPPVGWMSLFWVLGLRF